MPKKGKGKPEARVRRVCILTGGGDAPGLNPVIRAFTKTAIDLGIEVLGSEDGFEGLIQPGRLVPLTKDRVRGILPRGGSILGCSNKANPFAYPRRDKRGRETTEVEVVGVVRMDRDRHTLGYPSDLPPVFVPFRRMREGRLLVRTRGPAEAFIPTFMAIAREEARLVPVSRMRTLAEGDRLRRKSRIDATAFVR